MRVSSSSTVKDEQHSIPEPDAHSLLTIIRGMVFLPLFSELPETSSFAPANPLVSTGCAILKRHKMPLHDSKSQRLPMTRNRAGQAGGQRREPLVLLGFRGYLRFSTAPYLRIFYVFSTLFYALPLAAVRRQSVGNQSCSGIEAVITSLTRNQVYQQWYRGFESHPLRQSRAYQCDTPCFSSL